MDEEPPKKSSTPISTIIITVAAIIIILVLAFLLYYYSSLPVPSVVEGPAPVYVRPAVVIVPTVVTKFAPPETLPDASEDGSCFAGSIAAPFRVDAWRCTVGNSIHDPCFETSRKNLVFCQENPLAPDSTLIKLEKALPAPSLPPVLQDNWAWFVKLKDGAFCSPFTGTRPFFGQDQIAYYGCSSADKTQQVFLLGDLVKGNVWSATEAIAAKTGNNWTITSSKKVDVDTIWQ